MSKLRAPSREEAQGELVVQRAMRALSKEVGPVLRKCQARAANMKMYAEELGILLGGKPKDVKELEYAKRDLKSARTHFRKVLPRFYPAVKEALGVPLAMADARIRFRRGIQKRLRIKWLWPLGRRPGQRGAPRLPAEFLIFGEDAVKELMKMEVKETVAAHWAAECLKPYLPYRQREVDGKYSFNGKQLLRHIRAQKTREA